MVLDAPLSFWGGFDPNTGEIIDQRHPQTGIRMTGRILVAPETRGSAGTPAGVAESIRRAVGPVGVVLAKPDVNLTVGAMVAARLYGIHIPVICLNPADYAMIGPGDTLSIDTDACVTIRAQP